MGASFLARNLTWWDIRSDTAIITPTGRSKSKFVREVFERLCDGPFEKNNKSFGPFTPTWESTEAEELKSLFQQIQLPDEPDSLLSIDDIQLPEDSSVGREMMSWMEKQMNLGGRSSFSVGELKEQINNIFRRIRGFSYSKISGTRVMTIQQAKNREFQNVIVLWPFEIKGNDERKRRLFYNAITRAKRQVLVIVQDNPRGKSRLINPPFNMVVDEK